MGHLLKPLECALYFEEKYYSNSLTENLQHLLLFFLVVGDSLAGNLHFSLNSYEQDLNFALLFDFLLDFQQNSLSSELESQFYQSESDLVDFCLLGLSECSIQQDKLLN